jgi:hypothetical protein
MNNDWTFKTVIAYDTYASAIHAKEMSERVAGQMECEVDAWPFGLLALRWIREQAIEVAAAADMIILAADGALELPRSVKDWIEGGLGGKGQRPVALVALLDDYPISLGEPPPLCAYLTHLAQQRNAEFFCNLTFGGTETPLETATYSQNSVPKCQTEALPSILSHRGEASMRRAG